MQRPQQHITDSLGENQLRSTFTPLGWAVNKIEHDYGADFEIEIFRDYKSTGASFKVQLKSSESTQYSAEGSYVSQVIDKPNAQYLCNEVRAPVVIIHADVRNRRTFWLAPQVDVAALDAFARKPDSRTLTLRIPTANELPLTVDSLVEAVSSAEILLASRVIISAAVPDFTRSVRGRVDEGEVVRELRIKADALRVSRLQGLFEAGKLNETRERIGKVLSDPQSSVGMKFWAILLAEKVELKDMRAAGRNADRVQLQLGIAARLHQITRNGPAHLKFHALIMRKASELDSLIMTDFGLYINWKVNEPGGDAFWKVQLAFERAALVRRIIQKYNQCLRLAGYAAGYKHQWALPDALLRIVVASSIFIFRLRSEGMEEAGRKLVQSSMAICQLAATIAANYQDGDKLSDAAIAGFMIDPADGSEPRTWATETLKTIEDPQIRRAAEDRMRVYVQAQRTNEIEAAKKRHFSVEEARQVYVNMANALGIDLADPKDKIAQVVRIGLKDLDPSRVLRNCEHIFLSLSFHGVVAEWLQLPTAGGKVVHCDLHRYAVEGLDLDVAYSGFKQLYCNKCRDCSPRPSTWEYSQEWQEEENKKHERFMKDFDQRIGRRAVSE